MAKFGSTGEAGKKKFGSEAGRQRIQERRERLAEVREAGKAGVPRSSESGESGHAKDSPKKRR